MHPAWLAPLLQSDAEIFEQCVIGVESSPIRSKYSDVLRCEVQNLPKLCFLFADFFFRNFALFDFYTRTVPFDDFSRFVAQWFFTMKEPTVMAVSPPHARLRHERFSGYERVAQGAHQCFYIFRMNRCGPAPAEQVRHRDAYIFQPAAVKEVEFTIRQSRMNKCRSCIYQMAILALASAQLLLSPFTLRDVDHGSR